MNADAGTLPQVVGSFPPVSLEELSRRAELLVRVDRKYLLGKALATRILSELQLSAQALEIGGQRSFGYRSVYFDLPQLDTFYAAARRRRRRFKVRVRTYRDSGEAWLEVKTRSGGRLTTKDRLPVDPDLALAACLPSYATRYVEEIVTLRLGYDFDLPDLGELRSAMSTDYQRSTLLIHDGEDRITIDEGLTVGRPTGTGQRLRLRDQVVLETKSVSGRSAVDHALWRRGVRPTRISKYATGLALLDPTLPRNRWTRTIT